MHFPEPTIGVRSGIPETVVSGNPHNNQNDEQNFIEVIIIDDDDPTQSNTALLSKEHYEKILSGQSTIDKVFDAGKWSYFVVDFADEASDYLDISSNTASGFSGISNDRNSISGATTSSSMNFPVTTSTTPTFGLASQSNSSPFPMAQNSSASTLSIPPLSSVTDVVTTSSLIGSSTSPPSVSTSPFQLNTLGTSTAGSFGNSLASTSTTLPLFSIPQSSSFSLFGSTASAFGPSLNVSTAVLPGFDGSPTALIRSSSCGVEPSGGYWTSDDPRFVPPRGTNFVNGG